MYNIILSTELIFLLLPYNVISSKELHGIFFEQGIILLSRKQKRGKRWWRKRKVSFVMSIIQVFNIVKLSFACTLSCFWEFETAESEKLGAIILCSFFTFTHKKMLFKYLSMTMNPILDVNVDVRKCIAKTRIGKIKFILRVIGSLTIVIQSWLCQSTITWWQRDKDCSSTKYFWF